MRVIQSPPYGHKLLGVPLWSWWIWESPSGPVPIRVSPSRAARPAPSREPGPGAEMGELTNEVTNLRLAKTTAVKERDFYLAKLMSIEHIFVENEPDAGDTTLLKIFEVLCAVENFTPEAEDGEEEPGEF
ncbi:hypothetical protein N1851_019419 [Merluccius polli]|uniref:EB1 C-terminal domain-containing protein n=1 Tax=Merluccius polli TaxID=89951 RepID=A0AA47MM72_MERPO|nr:hypothetical protein N1851_019419 [Merluccius polli]